jgi:hypothetical protein
MLNFAIAVDGQSLIAVGALFGIFIAHKAMPGWSFCASIVLQLRTFSVPESPLHHEPYLSYRSPQIRRAHYTRKTFAICMLTGQFSSLYSCWNLGFPRTG